MIVTRTPLRISFFSGGSDMAAFYEQEKGAALSVTINKFNYVSVHQTPAIGVRMMYDKVEDYEDVYKMQSDIVSQALLKYNLPREITVTSVSDIIAKGSGLGSSSAFTVGLCNALQSLVHQTPKRRELAQIACQIEIEKCGYPIGKQDQYAAAYGGFNMFEFHPSGKVTVDSLDDVVSSDVMTNLEQNLLLVYSGVGRSANAILSKQKAAMLNEDKFNLVRRSRNKAYTACQLLVDGDIDSFGALLHEAWQDKKQVVKEITQDYFDDVYTKAIKAGALGGKLLGAGGGGFFIFYCKPDVREAVELAVTTDTNCRIYPFKFHEGGSEIVAVA